MKNNSLKTIFAVLTALLMLTGFVSCADDSPDEPSSEISGIVASSEASQPDDDDPSVVETSSQASDEVSEDISLGEPSEISENEPSEVSEEEPSEVSEEESSEVSEDESSEVSEEESSEVSEEESSEAEPEPKQKLKYAETTVPSQLASNIALGRSYTAESAFFRTDNYGDSFDSEGKSLRGKLTDGVTVETGASSNIAGYGGNHLEITIDLEEERIVYGFSARYYGGLWGIALPENVVVEYRVSYDNEVYFSCGFVSPSLGNAETTEIDGWFTCSFESLLDKPIYARYVKVIFDVDGEHIWSDEIRIMGVSGEELSGTTKRIYINTINNDRVHRSTYHGCSLFAYDPNGEYKNIFDENAEIKIRGNSTSSGAKAPYNIRFESKQDLFGMGKCKKWYLLANMYDKTQIRNKLAFDFASAVGMSYVQQSTFVEVYLNGEYRGLYQLCESIGVGDSRVDIDITTNEFLMEYEPWPQYSNEEWITTPRYSIILGFNDPESPSASQRSFLEEFFVNAETAIASKNLEKMSKYIDIDSFVDAYIVQEFFKQVDYGTSSTRFYIKDGILYQGPVWDFDLSSGNCSSIYYAGYNNVGGSGNSWEGWHCRSIWNRYLFDCPEFEKLVVERYAELQPLIRSMYEDVGDADCRIDALLSEFGEDIDKNYTVWSTSEIYSELERVPTNGTYSAEITYLRSWFKNRNAWILEQFGLNSGN